MILALKKHQLQGALPPDPHQGALPPWPPSYLGPPNNLSWCRPWLVPPLELQNTGSSMYSASKQLYNAAFRLACRSPHCRFDDDICTTAQAPLAAEWWPSSKQHLANRSITLPLCPPRQITDSWILFNLGAMLLGDKAKAEWSLRAATLKQQAMIMRCSGKAASSKLVWTSIRVGPLLALVTTTVSSTTDCNSYMFAGLSLCWSAPFSKLTLKGILDCQIDLSVPQNSYKMPVATWCSILIIATWFSILIQFLVKFSQHLYWLVATLHDC